MMKYQGGYVHEMFLKKKLLVYLPDESNKP